MTLVVKADQVAERTGDTLQTLKTEPMYNLLLECSAHPLDYAVLTGGYEA
jgi:hypothetical protein